jgi:hypothetical protein
MTCATTCATAAALGRGKRKEIGQTPLLSKLMPPMLQCLNKKKKEKSQDVG